MSKYPMFLCWSDEDQAYVVTVPDLPGCMADGATPIEAIKNAETIINEWIECAIDDGDPIPSPSKYKTVLDGTT